MGRRSDHSRSELTALILDAGTALMEEVGYADFSGREVAKRIGYTVGTIHNVYRNIDGLVTAINTRTLGEWADDVAAELAQAGQDRIAMLVHAYFKFARRHPARWAAIYDHRPDCANLTAAQEEERGRLMRIVASEVAAALGRPYDAEIGTYARSLVATVHGHCSLALGGSWTAMGQTNAEEEALARVRESLTAFCPERPADRG